MKSSMGSQITAAEKMLGGVVLSFGAELASTLMGKERKVPEFVDGGRGLIDKNDKAATAAASMGRKLKSKYDV